MPQIYSGLHIDATQQTPIRVSGSGQAPAPSKASQDSLGLAGASEVLPGLLLNGLLRFSVGGTTTSRAFAQERFERKLLANDESRALLYARTVPLVAGMASVYYAHKILTAVRELI